MSSDGGGEPVDGSGDRVFGLGRDCRATGQIRSGLLVLKKGSALALSEPFRRTVIEIRVPRSRPVGLCQRRWPGKPTHNGFITALNNKPIRMPARAWPLPPGPGAPQWHRHEHGGRSEKAGSLGRTDNEDRPRSAIGYTAPTALHHPGGATGPSP